MEDNVRTAGRRIFPLYLDRLSPRHLFRAVGHRAVPGILGLASILFLAGCGAASPNNSSNATITISPQPASVPVGGMVTFEATSSNVTPPLTWYLGAPASGTLSSTTGATVTYTAPATPPAVTGIGDCGLQGVVVLGATGEATGGYSTNVSTSFVITAPAVTVSLTPATASVALGAYQTFQGYAVGSIDSTVTWQVNGVTDGSTSTGILTEGYFLLNEIYIFDGSCMVYTAPTVMPMTGNTVTITMISQADPTKTQTAIVMLQ
jgi:hypothetical protein